MRAIDLRKLCDGQQPDFKKNLIAADGTGAHLLTE